VNLGLNALLDWALYRPLGARGIVLSTSIVSAFNFVALVWLMRRQIGLVDGRRIEVVAPSFLSLPGLVLGTNRIATMHRRLAAQVVQNLPLVMREVPFDIPPIREAIQWHLSNNNDRALRWVVERLSAYAQEGGPAARGNGNVVPIAPLAEVHRDAIAAQFQQLNSGR